MAFLSEYGTIDDCIFHTEGYHAIIDTIAGLLLFSIIEEEVNTLGITIIGYEKSLWKKKQKGYVKLELIQNPPLDYMNEPALPFEDIFIGFEFWSEYESITTNDYLTYNLGKPRRCILNYGVLLKAIELTGDFYRDKVYDELNNSLQGILSTGFNNSTQKMKMLNEVKEKFEIFKKFKKNLMCK